MQITERQALLLRKVVEGHVDHGVPVGSKWLAEQEDVTWGPSTVRAELSRLEELGLLRHPHTSAGRVPTDHGYRLYAVTHPEVNPSRIVAKGPAIDFTPPHGRDRRG